MKPGIPDSSLDAVLLALADPTRRAILARLARGRARVTELAEPFSMSLNSVSKHIRVLERARLIRRQVRGREHLLSLDPKPLDQTAAWLDGQRALWTRRLLALDDLFQEEDRTSGRAGKGRR